MILIVFSVLLVAAAIWIALQRRSTPEKDERKRRQTLSERGRYGEAFITEVAGDLIFYNYSVQGVQYTASQDVSTLTEYLPAEAERLIGAASMRYSANNPGNSILICEEWSGLRPQVKAATETPEPLQRTFI